MCSSRGFHSGKQVTGNEGYYPVTVPAYERLTNALLWLCFLHVFPSTLLDDFIKRNYYSYSLKENFCTEYFPSQSGSEVNTDLLPKL